MNQTLSQCRRPERGPVVPEDVYIFFIGGADEPALLAVASRVAKLHGVPPGAFAVVTDDEADEYGQGLRVELASS
ncbi:hypothetical protein [Micromonospora sp. NBC_01638]|uniref:hypothetical protein n=1 Tax=Micromonospora sp. NBC_01638 TaxID=2975982 RepID=UPI003868ED57|nr:hypothetical protein OG811_19475 [Micromonospora sp. NBC_01638]